LRALWTPQDTAEMLTTGRNRYGAVSGNRVDVVQHSTQYMSDGDLRAVGAYLESLPAAGRDKPMQVPHPPAPAIARAGPPAADISSRVPA
ncbi:cytochrome C, partial [Burkholderia pseudomallei]